MFPKTVQKKFGGYTHPIGKTRSMQMMRSLSPGADGMTYENEPTYAGLTVLRWNMSVTSSLDNRTKTWTGSAYQTACRMWGKARQNCSDAGAACLLLVLLTLGVSEFSCTNMLRIRRRQQCA